MGVRIVSGLEPFPSWLTIRARRSACELKVDATNQTCLHHLHVHWRPLGGFSYPLQSLPVLGHAQTLLVC